MHRERGPASPTRGWVNVGVVLRVVARVGHDASRRTALCVTDRKCGRACNEYENRATKSTILGVGKERDILPRVLLSITSLIARGYNDSHPLPSSCTIVTAICLIRFIIYDDARDNKFDRWPSLFLSGYACSFLPGVSLFYFRSCPRIVTSAAAENTENPVNALSFRETCPARSVFNELVPSFPSSTSRLITSRTEHEGGGKKKTVETAGSRGRKEGTRDGGIFQRWHGVFSRFSIA